MLKYSLFPLKQQLCDCSKLRFYEPVGAFRSSFNYNNAIYGLMAYITEQLAGSPWEELVMEHIFQPASMTSSSFTHVMNLSRDDIAVPYLFDSDGLRPVDLQFHR